MLVLDGNMKNNREVCYASSAGYAEFSGLAGKVSTGCPNTPAHKSRYCLLHSPITVTPQAIQFSDTDALATSVSREYDDRQVAIITSKRVTRNSTFYEVSSKIPSLVKKAKPILLSSKGCLAWTSSY